MKLKFFKNEMDKQKVRRLMLKEAISLLVTNGIFKNEAYAKIVLKRTVVRRAAETLKNKI